MLPSDSWQSPQPPPAYGAPLAPSDPGHAQASYYHQPLVPDAQLLSHGASSPWGPQAPWETDAYDFLAEVCAMGTGCGSDAGVGSGSGHGSAPPGEPFIDLCSSSDESVSCIDLCDLSSLESDSDEPDINLNSSLMVMMRHHTALLHINLSRL